MTLPSGWAVSRIGDLGEVVTGSTPSTKNPSYYGGVVPFVRPPDLHERGIRNTSTTLSEMGAAVARTAPEGAVLIGCIGSLGKTGLTTARVSFNQQINAVIPHETAMAAWIFRAVQASDFQQQLQDNSSATTVAIINKSRFSGLLIPLAPLLEQHRIIEAVESYLTRLDAAVATLERVKANLKRYRASVLKAAVEGRLVPTEAELAREQGRDYEPAAVLLERVLKERRRRWEEAELGKLKAKGEVPKDDGRRKRYEEPVAPDTSNLPELPEGWCWATLEALFQTITDGDHLPPPQTGEGVPFLVIGDVRSGKPDWTRTRFVPTRYYKSLDQTRRPQRKDILYTVTGSFGIPVLVDFDRRFCVQRHIAILRPTALTNEAFYARILASTFVFQQAIAMSTGTAQKTVPLKGLRQIAVPLPPALEQERILTELERRLSILEGISTAAAANALRCHRLRQSILKWAFEGTLVGQDPTDEPASVLLERIRAEREKIDDANHKRPRGRRKKVTA